ncbi:hypothetical protein ABMA27_009470 [Loxostege sticticalis]|uniref:Glutathione S-transferase 1-like n=1 Tax=Loxostege sticticalis TaxID=481309 RepID=A0ABR3H812_LOXSC
MGITLYGSNVSPPTRATMMLLDILGLSFDYREVNLLTREHYRPDYLSKNPLHTIPMIEDDDFRLVDSHVIMTYLVSKYGEEKTHLYPKELRAKSLVDEKLYFDASILFPRLRNVIYGIALGKSSVTELQLKDIEESYGFVNTYLEKTRYIAGDTLTVADLSCVATLSSLHAVVEISDKYVKLHQWWERLKGESWYQVNVPGATTFGVFMNSLLRR